MSRPAIAQASVIAALNRHGPSHVHRLSELTGLHVATVRRVAQIARKAGQAHVAGHVQLGGVGGVANLWAAGPGADTAYQPKPRDPAHTGDWATREGAGRVLARLTCGPCSAKVLADECFVSLRATRRHLYDLHAAGRIHLADWLRSTGVGGHYTKVWALGPGPDAPRPKARTKSENFRAWVDRKVEKYGPKIAKRIIRSRRNGGADTIVVDGRTVYRRGAVIAPKRAQPKEPTA